MNSSGLFHLPDIWLNGRFPLASSFGNRAVRPRKRSPERPPERAACDSSSSNEGIGNVQLNGLPSAPVLRRFNLLADKHRQLSRTISSALS